MAEDRPIAALTDAETVHLINQFEVLAEHREPPLRVRVLGVPGFGECGEGTLAECPKSALYVAIAVLDETPDEAVYRLPDAYGWHFAGWTELPDWHALDDRHHPEAAFVRIRLTEDSLPPKAGATAWVQRDYEVEVNPWQGYLREVGGAPEPAEGTDPEGGP